MSKEPACLHLQSPAAPTAAGTALSSSPTAAYISLHPSCQAAHQLSPRAAGFLRQARPCPLSTLRQCTSSLGPSTTSSQCRRVLSRVPARRHICCCTSAHPRASLQSCLHSGITTMAAPAGLTRGNPRRKGTSQTRLRCLHPSSGHAEGIHQQDCSTTSTSMLFCNATR